MSVGRKTWPQKEGTNPLREDLKEERRPSRLILCLIPLFRSHSDARFLRQKEFRIQFIDVGATPPRPVDDVFYSRAAGGDALHDECEYNRKRRRIRRPSVGGVPFFGAGCKSEGRRRRTTRVVVEREDEESRNSELHVEKHACDFFERREIAVAFEGGRRETGAAFGRGRRGGRRRSAER